MIIFSLSANAEELCPTEHAFMTCWTGDGQACGRRGDGFFPITKMILIFPAGYQNDTDFTTDVDTLRV